MPILTAGLITGGAQLLGGLFGAGAAKRAASKAANEKRMQTMRLASLEESRQDIINPYDNVEDLSGSITNPYEQLGVATQAAEMQAEQADISLANTLDTLRSTGSGAGGATALAQAALQSKKGISASIEVQEAQNEKARAQGEQYKNQLQMSEKQRVQDATSRGRQFEFNAKEARQQGKIDRVSAQLGGAQARESQANADRTGAITSAIGGIAGTFGSMASSGAFDKKTPPKNNIQTPSIKNEN